MAWSLAVSANFVLLCMEFEFSRVAQVDEFVLGFAGFWWFLWLPFGHFTA
jgi:hypothetical protein